MPGHGGTRAVVMGQESIGRRNLRNRWHQAEAEARRRKKTGPGCPLALLAFVACVACVIFAAAVMVNVAFFTEPGSTYSPPAGTSTTTPRSIP